MKEYCYFLLLLLMIIGAKSYGQCPAVDTLYFSTQSEIDNFLVDYPGCTNFEGSVKIEDNLSTDPILNLNGLQNLTTLSGFLMIEGCDSLVTLIGLENLTSIDGSMTIWYNDNLQYLLGLDNLQSIGGSVWISNNDLQNLSGLGNLNFIGTSLSLKNNEDLVNLNGLEGLSAIEGEVLSIQDNDNLLNLTGLENISSLSGTLAIRYNNNLQTLSGLDNLESVGGFLEIDGNDHLHSLNGLESLMSIESFLAIKDNDSLQDLSGLESLITIGKGFEVLRNNNLQSLGSLNSLTTIGRHLEIEDNGNLQTIGALGNLTSIGEYFRLQNNESLLQIDGFEELDSIGGYLQIYSNDNLHSINGLGNLTTIGGYLIIRYNDSLQSISGLNSIVSINGYLKILHNDNLQNLTGINSLIYIGGDMLVAGNDNLQSLSELDNLQFIGGELGIVDNDSLRNLVGLENLSSIGEDLRIMKNRNLETLGDLESLHTIGGDLFISENSNLSLCAIIPICDYLSTVNGVINIFDNAFGCNNQYEILFQCDNLGKITVNIYYDLNENAIQDVGEPFLPHIKGLLEPEGYTLCSNATNGGVKYLNYGTYVVSLDENEFTNWELTSDSSVYNIVLDSVSNNETLYFGLYPTSNLSKLSPHCVNSLPRCNEFVTFEPFVFNEGTTIVNGTLWLDIDLEVLAATYIDIPDTLVGDNKLGWHFTELYPGHTFKREISLQLPGPPVFPLGDYLNFNIQSDFVDETNTYNIVNTHKVEVQCSYDPNDKLVSPQYPDNYALIGEDLIYTVRFQNTGNAEAYDVVIKDLLSANLDLSTFRFLSSSHESVLSTYIKNRMLTFEFKDIFLPDSTTNFDDSQGYVMYSIRANNNIPEYTKITNTASIFFDFNPAVITNTTENTMLSTFDFDQDGFDLWNDCDDNNKFVNPDAIEIPKNGIDEDCDGMDADVLLDIRAQTQIFPNPTTGLLHIKFPANVSGSYEIRDVRGQLIEKEEIRREISINLEKLPSGVYVLLLQSDAQIWFEQVVKF